MNNDNKRIITNKWEFLQFLFEELLNPRKWYDNLLSKLVNENTKLTRGMVFNLMIEGLVFTWLAGSYLTSLPPALLAMWKNCEFSPPDYTLWFLGTIVLCLLFVSFEGLFPLNKK